MIHSDNPAYMAGFNSQESQGDSMIHSDNPAYMAGFNSQENEQCPFDDDAAEAGWWRLGHFDKWKLNPPLNEAIGERLWGRPKA